MDSPDIGLPAVAFPADDFRAHPVGGAGRRADARSGHTDGLQTLAGPKVAQLDVALRVPQNIGSLKSNVQIDLSFGLFFFS